MIVELTERGRKKAADIIRRHRLAERLFTDSLALDSETEIEQQACKFEHILSPEATDKICTFLSHPRTCPHGAPIPRGTCCEQHAQQLKIETDFASRLARWGAGSKTQSADALADSAPATFSGHGGSTFTSIHKIMKGKIVSAIATSSPSLVIRPIL